MSPILIVPLARRATRTVLRTRAAVETGNNTNSGELQDSTSILIGAGLVCFILLLLGFWLVAWWRPTGSRPITNVSRRRLPDMSERWGSWMPWRRNASDTNPHIVSNNSRRISHVFSPLAASHTQISTVTVPAAAVIAGDTIPGWTNNRSDLTGPGFHFIPGGRRGTAFSGVTTPSFVDSETLNEFHDSSYELDYEVQVEMVKSARHAFTAVEEGCVREECGAAGDNGSVISALNGIDGREGSVNGVVQGTMGSQSKVVVTGLDVDIPEVDKVAMGRQALQ